MTTTTAAANLTRAPARQAEPFAGPTRLVSASELTAGHRVTYRHRGALVSETVASAQQMAVPDGYIAVRFTGRQHDVHYPVTTRLRVAR